MDETAVDDTAVGHADLDRPLFPRVVLSDGEVMTIEDEDDACSPASPNTVQFAALMAIRRLVSGEGVLVRVLVGKPLILRLTARGLRRPLLETTRISRISAMASSAIHDIS